MRRTLPSILPSITPSRLLLAVLVILGSAVGARAQERLCDTHLEDCRAPIIDMIRAETVGIDVEFWFMEDARYANELVNRFNAGVPIRILVDSRANASKRLNAQMLQTLADAHIPMREKFDSDILHHKVFLFHGQNVVEFSKANFTDPEFVPISPTNYSDEAVYFTNDSRLTNSFRRRFDDNWTDTTLFRNYANVSGPLVRKYPLYPIDPSMNFPPLEDFPLRAIGRMDAEPNAIDAIVFRVTDPRMSDAATRAVARGAQVRLISEPTEYRNATRYLDAREIDRMWLGGVQIKMRQHEGLTHEASIVLHTLNEVIFGSSNWTPKASAGYSDEHNLFYSPALNKPWFYQWFTDQFNRNWADTVNYVPFQPLPPDTPSYVTPANGATGVSTNVTFTWDGGPWAWTYDIYLGTSPNPPLVVANAQLGSAQPGVQESFTANLQSGTTYYWRVVGKTTAQISVSGPTYSFKTTGTAGGGGEAPFGGTPAAIPGTIQAENFDTGGQLTAYFDTTTGNSGNVYRTTEDVDLETTNDTGGGYNVMKTRAGEWLKYTVNVATSGTYTFETRFANIGTGATFHLEVDGVDRTGPIAMGDTGAWDVWQTIATPGVSLNAGQHVLRVVLDTIGTGGAVGAINWFRFTSTGSTQQPPPNPAYGGTPVALPGTIQAENFDIGTEGVAYHDTTVGNKGGAYRATDVDLGTTADAGGGYYVGWTPAGEWLNYTVNIGTTGTYTLETRVANVGTGATFHVEVDGVDKTGRIAVPNTGGWDVWQTISTPGVTLPAGQHLLRVVLDTIGTGGAVGGFNWFKFSNGTVTQPTSPAYGGTPVALPGTVQAENFDVGADGVAYHDTTIGNKGGAYRSTNVDIGTTNDVGGGYYIGWTRAGEWMNYSVNVTMTGTYTLETRLANIGTGATFHVEVDGVDKTGRIAMPDTGAWDAWQTLSTPGVPLTSGQHVIRVVLDTIGTGGAVGGLNWFRFFIP